MLNTNKLWKFPAPSSTAMLSDIKLIYGSEVCLHFDYYDRNQDAIFNSGILFEGVQAHRHTCEKFLENESKKNADFITEAYDFLVEYLDSEWIESVT
jgi:hypothetical protein